MASVAIFGGGVAGLSAAHELVSRGFAVDVYEPHDLGGKAASQAAAAFPGPTGARRPLLGEHGFRFFPGFYRNIIATLDEIPGPVAGETVRQDLVASRNAGIAWRSGSGVSTLYPFARRGLPPSWDVFGRVRRLFQGLGFTYADLGRMAWFRLKYLTSCPARRETYDDASWWQFIDGDSPHYSPQFKLFEASIPRTMSAMVAHTSSAKVIGDITMQFMLGYGRLGNDEDRLLRGPTTYRWIQPWRAWLATQGVTFFPAHELKEITYTAGSLHVTEAKVRSGSLTTTVNADHYLLALPVGDVRKQIQAVSALATDDAQLAKLVATGAPPDEAWMVGAQFALATDEPMVDGHVFYPQSPWALTSVSQAQFWNQNPAGPLEQLYGDGSVKGMLSIIISDWDTPSPRTGKAARKYATRDDLLEEVRLQLIDALGSGVDLSKPGNVQAWHLDTNVHLTGGTLPWENDTKLLVHPVGGRTYRPEVEKMTIDNLVLASDYVLTSTQLATMEGANEAARRAVNVILDRAASPHVRCPVWGLQEEPVFDEAKEIDAIRLGQGRPHVMDEFPVNLLAEMPVLLDLVQEALKLPIWLP